MEPIFVHFLMMQAYRTNDAIGPIASVLRVAKARVGGEFPILGQPRRQGARRDGDAEAFLDALRDVRSSVAAVVEHQRLENDLQRIGLALGALRREDAIAIVAVPQLDRLELLVALALAGDLGAVAEDAALQVRANQAGSTGAHGGAMLGGTAWHVGFPLDPPLPSRMYQRPGARQEGDPTNMAWGHPPLAGAKTLGGFVLGAPTLPAY